MAQIIFDSESLRMVNFFASMTGRSCKDCFGFNSTQVFVTNPGSNNSQIGRTVKLLEKNLNKRIKVVEYADSPENLARNFLLPCKPDSVYLAENILNIKFRFARERRVLLGKNLENLKLLKAVVSRYFPNISNIIVLQ